MLGVYIGSIMLLNIPYVQQVISTVVAEKLSQHLNTRLTIGRINMGLLNRVIIDNVRLEDQSRKEMLRIARLSAKFDILPLFEGKVSVSSVQLFGFNIQLNRPTPESPSNFRFIVDAFASKDTVKRDNQLDLRINSLLVRRGRVSYDVLSEQETPGRFNASHLHLHNIIGNLSVKALNKDSLNVGIKRLSLDEETSGFSLKKLSLKLTANHKRMEMHNFAIELPESKVEMDTIRMVYDHPGALEHFSEQVRFDFRTRSSYITLKDISPFVPSLASFESPVDITLEANGTIDHLNCPRIEITADNRQIRLAGNILFEKLSHPRQMYINGTLSELAVNTHGIDFLADNLSPKSKKVSPMLKRLGSIRFRGDIAGRISDLMVNGQLNTSLGTIRADLKLKSDQKQSLLYSGAVQTKDFRLGTLLDNSKMGGITLKVKVDGRQMAKQQPLLDVKGTIDALEYSKHRYENIVVDGKYEHGGFDGKITLDDPNGSIHMNGGFNVTSKIPVFNFSATVDNLRPNDLNLTTGYPDTEVSFRLRANFTGRSVNDMIGEINIDSLQFASPDKEYFMKNMNILANRDKGENHLHLTSEFLTADVKGHFQYHTLPASVVNITRRYVPSLMPSSQQSIDTRNNFEFDINIYNTDILSTVFNIPLTVYTHSTLKGYVNDTLQRLRIEGYFPRLQYKNNFIESGMVLCESFTDHIRTRIRLSNLKKNGVVNLSLDTQAKDDKINATLNWGNNGVATYSGQLSAIASLLRTQEESPLKAVVDVKPTGVILNDTLWQIHPSQVVVDSGRIDVNNFYFSHSDRYVRINGRISDNPSDTVKVHLKDINMGYVFDIASISDDVDFEGDASGTAYASGVLKNPEMNTKLSVKNFSLNQGRLGNLEITGKWDNEHRGIDIDALISDVAPYPPSHITGTIYPLKPESGLDLNIEASNLNIKFLEHYMQSIANDIEGRVTGKVHFYGKFKGLNLDGAVMTNASMNFDVLGTRFAVQDTIHMSPTGLTFNYARIADAKGTMGSLNGYLRFKHFKNINYHFDIQANNMLLMNTKESTDVPFYGTVYGTGNATLSGNQTQGLEANVAIVTNPNTYFTYINGNVASAASNQFIKFVDKTPHRTIQDSVQILSYYEQMQQKKQIVEEKQKTDIRLNILLDATPDATMKIIMDPIAGDYISGRGTGNIRTEFYNKGDVRMFGNYQISQGIYKFSLQEVIRKDFIIKGGSTINFNGPPLNANMDIQATYTVNSASLNDLIPDASTVIQQPNVRVNCIMNLSGILASPSIKLGIELPNERDEVQTLVRNYISTDEQMNMQILYLLGIGKFYTENARTGNQNSNVMSSVLSSTLSGQLNNALSQLFETNNWNIGTNLSTGDKGWTDVEVEGILSGQLLNNRLLINGNFGYRDNPMANTNFVGDFEAEWLLNRSGEVRLKAYNETNDRYYTKTNLTTQGVGIIYKKDFDKWNELFFWNNWKIRKKKKEEQ